MEVKRRGRSIRSQWIYVGEGNVWNVPQGNLLGGRNEFVNHISARLNSFEMVSSHAFQFYRESCKKRRIK
uniref:Uncharacterized protein n=1 Tax=Anguilla anguilla TaxID=7936 RepID=A0A0E9WAE9_ANGAN